MFTLTCKSYGDKQSIPPRYVHGSVPGGKNISPGFTWEDPPVDTKSFAFSIIDPHPVANNWIHWLVIDIPFRERQLLEGASRANSLPQGSKELMNSYDELGYGGPAPPKGSGSHPYVATVYALNVPSLNLDRSTTLRQFQKAHEGRIIAEAGMTGYFEQK